MNMAQEESSRFLSEQIITYLGNKRRLLPMISQAVQRVRERLGGRKLRAFDAFSGSGIVARCLKQHCSCIYANDLETYSALLNRCYLSNRSEAARLSLQESLDELRRQIARDWAPGLTAELYAPADDADIRPGERVFYTHRNAVYLDTARQAIAKLPPQMQPFFLAPLLYEASVHTNTSGIFKGFYKNREGIGQFGGAACNALNRILADIELRMPVFSNFECESIILQQDATLAAHRLPELDFAYLDPPYNQHPYGSNYFMLNFLAEYRRPAAISPVSGIPRNWNHSAYNSRKQAAAALQGLLDSLSAPFILLSYNSEGFIKLAEMRDLLSRSWKAEIVQQDYATFRGCRNLRNRALSVKEYFFLLERK